MADLKWFESVRNAKTENFKIALQFMEVSESKTDQIIENLRFAFILWDVCTVLSLCVCVCVCNGWLQIQNKIVKTHTIKKRY